jgi:predicted transcriptional regulator
MTEATSANYIELAADIVSAYVSNNPVPANELSSLIQEVHSALLRVTSGTPAPVSSEAQKPAIAVKKSLNSDYIICLEDGKKFKSLKRHLRTQYNMSPEEYRDKWGLPPDYPMVAPNYAKARSNLAKQMGLGQQRRRA